jgi:AbiV family abortive infection protein
MGSKSKENIVLDRKHGPIFYNAVRLFDDAKILRKARRYPSSAALAILSLEELGKFLVHDNDFTSWISPRHMREKHQYHHREKQRLAAEALTIFKTENDLDAVMGPAPSKR